MKIRNPKKVASLIMGAVAAAKFAGANLQTLVLGATEITEELTELVAEEYFVGDAEGFLHFRDLVNARRVSKDAKIMLTANLDLTEGGKYIHGYCDKLERKEDDSVEWGSSNRYIPVGTRVNRFIAKFDGQGQEITLTANLEAKTTAARVYAGVFGVICRGGVVANLKISEGSYIAARDSSGAFALYAGGVVGEAQEGSEISKCSNEGKVSCEITGGEECYVGGIAGEILKESKISESRNGGEVKVSGAVWGSYAGGVAGYARDGSEINVCHNQGAVSCESTGVEAYVGGIAGGILGRSKISECDNEGDVKASGAAKRIYAGGVVGHAWVSCEISGCYNQSAVSCESTRGRRCSAGGIAGGILEKSKISRCYNGRDVKASGAEQESYAGGVAGYAEMGSRINVCGNQGTVSCESTRGGCFAGGVVGIIVRGGEINGCHNIGEVSCEITGGEKCSAGGVVGEAGDSKISECRNEGKIRISGAVQECRAGGIAGQTEEGREILENSAARWIGEGEGVVVRNVEARLGEDMKTREFANLLNSALSRVRVNAGTWRFSIENFDYPNPRYTQRIQEVGIRANGGSNAVFR